MKILQHHLHNILWNVIINHLSHIRLYPHLTTVGFVSILAEIVFKSGYLY